MRKKNLVYFFLEIEIGAFTGLKFKLVTEIRISNRKHLNSKYRKSKKNKHGKLIKCSMFIKNVGRRALIKSVQNMGV